MTTILSLPALLDLDPSWTSFGTCDLCGLLADPTANPGPPPNEQARRGCNPTGPDHREEASMTTDDADNYSDRATLRGDVRWVVHGERIEHAR